jgi:hypothetical protein
VSEVGSTAYWHERFSRCLGVLEETQSQLAAALAKVAELEVECERLRREVADVRFLDEHCSLLDLQQWAGPTWSLEVGHPDFVHGNHRVTRLTPVEARRAAVEYLKKEGKDG